LSDNIEYPWLRSYPENVRPSIDYPVQPLFAFLERAAERFPEQTATVFFGKRMSYQSLLEKAIRFANALGKLGVKKGDRVAIMLPNSPQAVISYYGILMAGGVVVPINPMNVAVELIQQLRDVDCRVMVYLDIRQEMVASIRKDAGLESCIVTGLQDFMPYLAALGYRRHQQNRGRTLGIMEGECIYRFSELLNASSSDYPNVELSPKEDLAVLQYTGGTTGIPKAAMLTHYNLVVNAMQIREWFTKSQEGKEVFLAVLPFFHVYCMTVAMNTAVQLAATLVLHHRFETDKALGDIERYKVTMFPGTPAMYVAIISHQNARLHNLSSIRACISGAASLSPDVAHIFEELTGGSLVEGFGLTEASPVTHCNPLYGKRKLSSVGIPLPDTDCKIVDLEHGTKEMPVGVAGELIIRGPQVMKGYWNMPEETALTLRDGWLYTGDIARLDKSGYAYIVDRKKDMVISGGYNIYPEHIELVIKEIPQVKDVAVAGIPDRFRGEKLKAYIVLKTDAELTREQVMEHCRQRLAAYKIPRLIEFRRHLPKTIMGKTLRRMLIEEEKSKPQGFDS